MNTGCREGLRLRRRFEKALIQWGWFDALEKAVEIMPLGFSKIDEFQRQVNKAESALFKARHAYAEHMAQCVVCSRNLVVSNAVSIIHEKLRGLFEDNGV